MDNKFNRLDNLLKKFAEEKTIPGCACVVMQNDGIAYEGYYGFADIASGKPITRDSMFRQEDASNLFASVVLGMLYEEGKFLYSDPLSDYLPEYSNPKKFVFAANGEMQAVHLSRPLTVRTAIATMCGLPNIVLPTDHDSDNPTYAMMNQRLKELYAKGVTPTLQEEVRAMGGVPLMFEPYSHWDYGFGLQIAGAVIEVITGKPLRQVYKERIINPLGLKNTDTYITADNAGRVVTAYHKNVDGSFTADGGELSRWYDPAKTPVGARTMVVSSAEDYAIFMQMLANGGTFKGQRFLAPGTVAMLMSNQLENHHYPDFVGGSDSKSRYCEGYGYSMGFRLVVRQKYGHNGHFDNFGGSGDLGTFVEADPIAKLAMSYAHNMTPNEDIYHHHRVRAVTYGCAL